MGNIRDMITTKARRMMRVSRPGEPPGYRYQHGLRTARIAAELALSEHLAHTVDLEALHFACLLHDIGKVHELPGEDHGEAGARIADTILEDHIDTDRRKMIRSCIMWHNKREDAPQTLPQEGRLLQDADLLDHFGAIEVWLIQYRVARHNGGIAEAVQEYRSARNWRRYALSSAYFPRTSARLRDRMCVAARYFFTLEKEAGIPDTRLAEGEYPG